MLGQTRGLVYNPFRIQDNPLLKACKAAVRPVDNLNKILKERLGL
jgi:hypothetical protein